MIKCEYCYTDNFDSPTQCNYCEAPLNIKRPVFNKPLEKFIEKDIYYATYPMLQKYNHVELLNLLILTKDKISAISKEQEIKQTKENQKYLSILVKNVHLIENMIFDKMGRVPKKLEKAELTRINRGRTSRIYTHNLHMNPKVPPPYHVYFAKRFNTNN